MSCDSLATGWAQWLAVQLCQCVSHFGGVVCVDPLQLTEGSPGCGEKRFKVSASTEEDCQVVCHSLAPVASM